MSLFGCTLRRLRQGSGWTQARLAEKLGVAESTVSLYESGKREPDITTINRLADIFGVSTDYLFGRSQAKGGAIAENCAAYEGDLPKEALRQLEEFKEFLRARYKK